MRDFFKQNAPGLAGVLLGGLLGLFLLLFPQTTANIVFFIFGTALIVAGVVHAILYFADDARNAIGGWQLATGIMLVLAGIAVFVLADALIAFLPFIFGLILLIGGVFLLVLGLISWHTPVAYLGGLAVLELFYTLATGGEMTDVLYALLSGGVILGAFFMATDYVTTPMTGAGKLIFGLGCAVLTFVIREFANMPEGCSFSILLMNLLTPYIDKLTMTHPFGAKPAVKKEAK